MYSTIKTVVEKNFARVVLDRPDVHNAFNETLIRELMDAFAELSTREELRAIVLEGEGKSFCAGADLEWMSRTSRYSVEENSEDARRMSRVFQKIDSSPVPVVAKVHGTALGGGCGLVACADIVIAAETTKFGLTEVKLGIIPAVISPFVVSKIGRGHARALFMTGERFPASRALTIGLIHQSVAASDLEAAVQGTIDSLLTSGPVAAREAKSWIRRITGLSKDEICAIAPEKIAALRASPEGREGISAFLEKRKPAWIG